ncbi:MAG: DUF1284 domain-containing protein [Defluviitaleaceae bacterium]|nr:DUF1284 domain-containing protein [Defluviitaleaceae bacterium]
MKLRPHHLLCTQGYEGKGYNSGFVDNMTAIVTHLRNDASAAIEIVFSTDDICVKCPHMLGIDLCKSNDKVKRLDGKVAAHFGIEEKSYIYQDITREINTKMTSATMNDICGECEWYPTSACKGNILGID